MLTATWENVREHAAGPLDYWGSRVVSSNPAVPTGSKPWPVERGQGWRLSMEIW